ncbi:MAG: hypothetical protein K9J12_16675 [Melioribacteraceae bacterium]|nr:hypothetical protein [Melioribacteraceae bacterium]MCF8263582.1 hypothetical protein [Melioribacteraceae bacterium]MCF8412425.1 hypothetical protein [Melioribacteraceae bacterium]MCF8430822.1 hypothetical protein [Melioribacteraceae bacterium]
MEKILVYKYKFVFNESIEKEFEIKIESDSLNIIKDENDNLPEWTLLENFKCSNCPLDSNEVKHCPVATNLVDIIEFFSDIPSYEEVRIYVESSDRNYFKDSSVQDGVSSFVGILMTTSGCPVLGKLKPLVRYHLPFASLEETEFRVFAMYSLAQIAKLKLGEKPDFDMVGLKHIYEEILKTNLNIASKIADVEMKDTSINALVGLNNFADSVSFSLDEDGLREYANLLSPLME